MKRPKPGDVYAIKLPGGGYRFGRLLYDNAIQIFHQSSATLDFDPLMIGDVDFTVTLYKSAFKDPRMGFVMNVPFQDENEAWPPKTYLHHIMNDTYSIYDRGKITPCAKKECENLEPMSVWELDHIIDRITKKVDWLGKMKSMKT